MGATPNPNTPTGHRILEVASRLFYDRGIRAVGVDLIAEQAQTTKKTIYDRFGSKDALVSAYLGRRAERWEAFLADWLARGTSAQGSERVLSVIDANEAWVEAEDAHRGCGFVNAHAELGAGHPGLAIVRADKLRARETFTSLVAEAGYADAERLGAQIHLVYEGAIVARTAGALDDAYEEARDAIRALLATAAPQDADRTPA
ncbi:TetR/AcrR family transcriptional regulator [Microbacterium marinilacus]|uniref:TetR/AcrR family transcriptional regulator n=1 Tax=Microbacterium marinilacus TaxID=415209 RepID=A0ABP7BG88_9MICO|nr:TetR/AcrR family transcriptional regulator [Microbacterium marinilacus]MBY0688930.1 TetR/AcrR family transcriptional regulator [Microbacterium marinilacus]